MDSQLLFLLQQTPPKRGGHKETSLVADLADAGNLICLQNKPEVESIGQRRKSLTYRGAGNERKIKA